MRGVETRCWGLEEWRRGGMRHGKEVDHVLEPRGGHAARKRSLSAAVVGSDLTKGPMRILGGQASGFRTAPAPTAGLSELTAMGREGEGREGGGE